MATTTIAAPMKIKVAAMERNDKRAIPHTPWPEVQPPPSREPKPTSSPAPATTTQLAGIRGTDSVKPTRLEMTGARTRPATNAARQPLPLALPMSPSTIPLTPAIRPVVSIKSAAANPIKVPPIAAESGVKLPTDSTKRE